MPDGTSFPARDLAIFLAASVILLSLTLAGIALPRLLNEMSLPEEPTEQQEEVRARRHAAKAAMMVIEQYNEVLTYQASDSKVYEQAAARVISLHRRHLMEDTASDSSAAAQIRNSDYVEHALQIAGLKAERDTTFSLTREGAISDETARIRVREVIAMTAWH